MKKHVLRVLALAMASLSIFSAGCQLPMGGGNGTNSSSAGHNHRFSVKKAEEEYLKTEADCLTAAEYYFSCECGEKGETTFVDGKPLNHDYSAEILEEEYFKTEADCQTGAEYYFACSRCGLKSKSKTFISDELGDHVYNKEVADAKYLKAEANFDNGAEYYKSCVCGAVGEETFFYGDPLKTYTEEEKIPFTPTSLTVTLYDAAESVYGFTYNTLSEPLRPVIQAAKGDSLNDCVEYAATSVTEYSSWDENGNTLQYYVVKVEVPMEMGETYTYRAYDKYVDVGSAAVTFEAKDTTSDKFSFIHISDTQDGPTNFGDVLSHVVGQNDFVVHTGDVVEDSRYEHEWTEMLQDNFEYVSKIPVMALAGNHEAVYLSGEHEVFKHFNYDLTRQDTEKGVYYSFVYGNAKFIMLNSGDWGVSSLDKTQFNWLKSELENNDCTWTFVGMHIPMYSAGRYGSDPSKNGTSVGFRKQLQALFVEYGVDVVFQGHDHLVSKTHALNESGTKVEETFEVKDGISYSVDPNGVIYIMSGPGGSQAGRTSYSGYTKAAYDYVGEGGKAKAGSWSEFIVDGNTLTVKGHYVNGSSVGTYDFAQWGIVKTA